MTTGWDRLWMEFKTLVGSLNDTVRPEERGFVVQVARSENDVFPLRAVAAYSPAASPGDEALVLSLDFQRTAGRIEGRVDFARGDGSVLADAPLVDQFAEADAPSDAAIGLATASLQQFLAAHRELVEQELLRRS